VDFPSCRCEHEAYKKLKNYAGFGKFFGGIGVHWIVARGHLAAVFVACDHG